MANEKGGTGNIIIDVLLRAGLQLDEKDAKALEARLRNAGESVKKGGKEAMEDMAVQAKELDKLLRNFERRRALLERAARKDFNIEDRKPGVKKGLAKGFSDAATLDRELGVLLNRMRNLAEANGERFFNETKTMALARKQITTLASAASKNVNGVGLELQKNLRKERENRKIADSELRRQALARNNALQSEQLKKGKQIFKQGQKSDFVGITNKRDAQEALRFAKVQAKYLQDTVELMVKRPGGLDSPDTKQAKRKSFEAASYVQKLSDRVKDLGDSETLKRRDEASARRIAKAEATYADNRSQRGTQQRNGMQALLEAGGVFAGNASRFNSTEKLSKAMKFLNGELTDSNNLFKVLRNELGETHPRVLRLSNSLTKMSGLKADMTDRDGKLRGLDKDAKQAETEAQRQAKDEAKLRQHLAKMDRRQDNGTAPKTAQELIDAAILKGREDKAAKKIKADKAVLDKEAKQRVKDQEAVQKALGKMEARDVAGTSPKTPQQLIDDGLAKGRGYSSAQEEKDRKVAQAKVAKADRAAADQRARDPEAYKLFLDAAANPASVTNVKDANRALQVGSKELGTMRTKQEALITATQQNTNEYRQLTAEIERAQRAMASLNDRKAVLAGEAKKGGGGGGGYVSARSGIYSTGREAFDASVGRAGGLEGLRGESFDQAKSYARAKLQESKQAYDALHRSGTATADQMRAAGDQVLHFEDALRRLGGGAGEASSKMAYLTNVFKMFFKYAVAYQSLYMLAEAMGAVARSVVNLQTDLLDIQAITASTGSDMAKLSSVVQSVAQNSKFSLDELTKATKTLAQAGVPLTELNTTLQATANFAAATGTSLETAADLMSTMRSVYKELNDDVIANQLAKAINISKLTGEGLRTIMSLGAQTAKDFSISSEQFLGAVASLRNAGLKDSTAATGLRQAMLEVFTPDNTLVQALKTRYQEIGETISSEAVRQRFFSFTQANNPLLAAMTELKRLGFSDEGQMVLTRAFDVRSSNAIRAMIANLGELSQFEGEITFGRAAAEGARVTIEGLNASWTRLVSTINSYAYNRSEGILGFLSEAIQGLDKAIQRWEQWENLKNAGAGLRGEEAEARRQAGLDSEGREDRRTAGQKFFDSTVDAITFKGAQDDFLRVRDIIDPAGAELRNIRKNISGTTNEMNNSERVRDSYNKEADQFDINRARAGEGPGTGADQIVKAAAIADQYTAMVTKAFGPEMAAQDEAMQTLLDSYVNLTQSQRKVREQELRGQFDTLSVLKPEEFDRAITDMASAGNQMQGKLGAMVKGMNKAIGDASVVFTQMDGAPAQNANEFKAQTLLSLHKANSALQRVLEGTSTLAAEEQIKIVEAFGQEAATQIRDGGGKLSQKTLVTQLVLNLSNRAKELNRTATLGGGGVEFQAEVSKVITAQQDSAQATLDYLEVLRTTMLEVSRVMGGNGSVFFTDGITQVENAIKATKPKVLKETADRVAGFNEKILPTLKDPSYKRSVEALPETDPTRDPLLGMIANPPSVDEARGNSKPYQMLAKSTKGFQDREAKQAALEVKVDETTAARLRLENLKGEAATKAAEFSSRNQFPEARANKAAEAGYAIQILEKKIADAKEEMRLNVERNDPNMESKNKALLEQRAGLVNDLMLVKRDLGKSTQDLNQEEAKVNNRRDTNAAKAKQTRLTDVLSNAGADTPKEVIQAAIEAYDKNQQELNRLLEERKVIEGTLSAESKAEIEEAQRKLLKYKEQNAYLDLLQRQEAEIRARNNRALEKPLSSGDTTEDARLGGLGVVPGSRTDRSQFLAYQAQLLADNVGSVNRQIQENEQTKSDAEAFLKANPDPNTVGYDQQSKNLSESSKKIDDLNAEMDGYRIRIGEIRNELNNVRQTLPGALDQAFNLDTIILGLEQADSGVEKLAVKIHTALIAGIEGVGDAFADSLLEGKDFFDSLNDLFIDTGKQILRDVIKTYTTETITSFLKGFSPKAKADAGTSDPVGNPLGGGLFGMGAGLLKKGWDWVTGAPPAAKTAPANVSGYGIGMELPIDEAPAGGVLISSANLMGTMGKAAGLTGSPQPAPAVGNNTVLADAAAGEAKGFFASLSDGFSSVWDVMSEGFTGALSGIGDLLGIGGGGGKGGGGGVLGLLTAIIPGMKTGGIIRAATGGIIVGRGTGTSDSVPGLIRAKNGKLHPLMTSNGESILNAKATSALGEGTIHSLNSGNFLRADTSGLSRDSARMMAGVQTGGGGSQSNFAKVPLKQYNTTQVAVTPAQMRMRMGDWLEQHVIEELGSR